MSENGEIYTAGKKFYTPAGTDGMDKFYLWVKKWMTIYENDKREIVPGLFLRQLQSSRNL